MREINGIRSLMLYSTSTAFKSINKTTFATKHSKKYSFKKKNSCTWWIKDARTKKESKDVQSFSRHQIGCIKFSNTF